MTNEFRMCDLSEGELRELLNKQPDWLLDFLSTRTLFDVRAIGMLLAMGRLAILYELECRQREQAEEQQFERQRASHIDEVLQTVTETVNAPVPSEVTENGLRAVIERMAEASKDLQELDKRPQAAVPVVQKWIEEAMPYPHPDDLPDEPPAAVPAVLQDWVEVADLGPLDVPDEPF